MCMRIFWGQRVMNQRAEPTSRLKREHVLGSLLPSGRTADVPVGHANPKTAESAPPGRTIHRRMAPPGQPSFVTAVSPDIPISDIRNHQPPPTLSSDTPPSSPPPANPTNETLHIYVLSDSSGDSK
jgi:hypothetical protein